MAEYPNPTSDKWLKTSLDIWFIPKEIIVRSDLGSRNVRQMPWSMFSRIMADKLKETRLHELHLMPHEAGCRSLNPVTSGGCDCYKAKRAGDIKHAK